MELTFTQPVAGAPADAARRAPAGRGRPAATRLRGALIQKRLIRQSFNVPARLRRRIVATN